jgi:hypothetical protein
MKFLVVLSLVGIVAAYEVDPVKRAAAMRLLSMEASEMHLCSSAEDCAGVPNRPKCDAHLRLCKPEAAPDFEMEFGQCADHLGCPPIYKCKESKCHFAGPKACENNSDCLQGIAGAEYECIESSKSAPGKRCYKKCEVEADCHDRVPEEAKAKLGCCNGHCQKKLAC